MAEKNPSDPPSPEVQEVLDEIKILKLEIRNLVAAGQEEKAKEKRQKVKDLYAGLPKRSRGKSTDSRASGTTVGTTHTSRETHDQIIHRLNQEINQLSSDLQKETDQNAIKKIKKKISQKKSKLKKRKAKHNTGAATPDTVKSVAQSLFSQITAAASAIPGAKKEEDSKSNVNGMGHVQIIKSKTNDALFPMLPPPILNDEFTDCIRNEKYYNAFHEYTPTQTHYSYESYATGEKPQTDVFYIHMQLDRKKKNNKTIKVNNNYVAYVNEKSYFSEDMSTLRNEDISGYLYMSVSSLYKKDNKKYVGMITFLIPYSKMESDAPVSKNTVCAIETSIPQYSEEIKNLTIFMEKFGNYVYASNIPLDSEGISMTENDIRALVRRFTNIQQHKKTLVRTYKGFDMKDQVTIWADINCKAESGTTDWKAKIKMLLPYVRQNDIIEAKNIIAKAIGQCQYAVALYHEEHPGDSQEFFKHIWGTTVWILIAEMSKEKMTNQRIADLSTGIMHKFEDVYLRDTENKTNWRKFLKHKPPTTPVLSLDYIFYMTGPKNTTGINQENSGSVSETRPNVVKLPDVNPIFGGVRNYDEGDKPAVAATQLRDW